MAGGPKRFESELWEDQVPPHAPGVPGNVAEVVDDGIDHGVAADGHVVAEPEPEPEPEVEDEPVEEEPEQ